MTSRHATAAPRLVGSAAPTAPVPARRARRRGFAGLAASFRFAARGLVEVAATERNMKLHVCAGVGVAVLGSEVPLPMPAQLAVVISVALVLAAEAVNSALEALVDLHTSELREEARRAKDAAAGAVLAMALGAAAVAAVVVTRSFEAAGPALDQLRHHLPGDAAILVACAALLALGPGRLAAKLAVAAAAAASLAGLAMRTVSGPLTAVAVALFLLSTAASLAPPRRGSAGGAPLGSAG